MSNMALLCRDMLDIGLDSAIKGVVLLMAAWGLSRMLRSQAASVRHLLWLAAMMGLVLLPVFSAGLPAWRLAMLPQSPRLQAAASVVSVESMNVRPSPYRWMPVVEPSLARREPEQVAKTQEVTAAVVADKPAASLASCVYAAVRSLSWCAWGLLVWASGCVLALAPWLRGMWVIRRVARRCRLAIDGEWRELVDDLCHQLGIRQRVRVLLSDDRGLMPLTFEMLRPTLVLPAEGAGWDASRRRIVAMHELAHVKRRDALTLALGQIARAMHWANPMAWYGLRQLRLSCEQAADDVALVGGAGPTDYAAELLAIARDFAALPDHAGAGLAMARASSLESRLRQILAEGLNRRGATRRAALMTLVCITTVLAPLASLQLTARQARAQQSNVPAPATQADVVATQPDRLDPFKPLITRNIEGKIVDSDRKPIVDADVLVLRVGPHYRGFNYPVEQEIVGRAQSNADGEFRIVVSAISEDADLYVIARKRDVGFWNSWGLGSPAKDGTIREVVLRKTGKLEGMVVDDSGQPIADAEVRADLFHEGSSDPDVLGCKALDWFAVRTGKDGRFVISGVPTEFNAEFVVRAAGRGTVATQIRGIGAEIPQYRPGQEGIRIVLPAECRIEGVALDKSTGKPVAGVKLIALRGDLALRRRYGGRGYHVTPPAIVTTDKEGRFAVDALEPAEWTITLAQQRMEDRVEPGEWVAMPAYANLTPGKTQSVRVELSRGELVEVALVNAATGSPARGALAAIKPESWWEMWANQASDERGIVRMRLLPGQYTFLAHDLPNPVVHPGQEVPKWLYGRLDLTVEHGKSQRVQVPLAYKSLVRRGGALHILDDSDDSAPSSRPATEAVK